MCVVTRVPGSPGGFKFRFADAHGETFNHDGLIAKRFKREIGQRRAQPILMRAGADIYRNRFAIGEARHESLNNSAL